MARTPRYECIGGPMDGKRIPRMPPTIPCQAFTCSLTVDGVMTLHYYRLCVCSTKVNGKQRQAKFWHYIGENPDLRRRPSLKPPRRMYK